jgi:hypothetical protein
LPVPWVSAQYPDLAHAAGPVVAAWPPIALYGTHRLLHNSQHHDSDDEAGRRS